MIYQYNLNDVLVTKKNHVCGLNQWKVIRFGADCKIECVKCHRVVMIAKRDLDKKIKKVLGQEKPNI